MNTKNILTDPLFHFYYINHVKYYMKAIKDQYKTIQIHVLCWAVYVIYEVLLTRAIKGEFSHFYYYFFFYLLNISLFYAHALYVMRSSFKNVPNTLWRLPLLLVLEMAIYIGLSILLSKLLMVLHVRKTALVLDWRFHISIIWRGLLFILFSTGYYFLDTYIIRRKNEMQKALEIERLQVALARAEHDFLRSQINSHLLFNTLSFVKYAAKHKPEQSDEAIIRLSEIMSFAIEKSANELIPIVDELKQIENVIQLNQLRFAYQLNLQFSTTIGDEKIRILPIILLTLVENVFKHGNLHQGSAPASIVLVSTTKKIEFWTKNLCKESELLTHASSGFGIPNTIFRLKNTYVDRFIFNYGMDGEFYQTYLCIDLLVN